MKEEKTFQKRLKEFTQEFLFKVGIHNIRLLKKVQVTDGKEYNNVNFDIYNSNN